MKKLFFLGALFAVGLGFTACSSDKDSVAESTPQGDLGGNNYIAISIKLPSDLSGMTRADDNGNQVTFDDGLSSEYTVNDATLIIFDQTTEKFKEAYNLSKDGFTTSGTDKQVTSHDTKIIQMVTSSVVANDLALVILNKNSLFTLDGNKVKFGSDEFTGTYSEFQEKTATTTGLNASTMTTSGFYMANAPLVDKPGSTTTAIASGANVQVLSPIRTLFKTYDEADAGTPDQIYVERGMAKVTMASTITTATLQNSKLGGSGALTASLTAWTLDNCNKTSYLVRSTAGHAGFLGLHSLASGGVYRYVGNSPITYPSQPDFPYRSYFAQSTNYSGTSDLVTVSDASAFKADFGPDKPQYCFENTFPVSKQTVKNTTLVQLKLTVGTGEDLYIAGGNKTIIYNETSLKTLIQDAVYGYVVAQDWVKEGTLSSTDFTITLGTFSTTTAIMGTDMTIAYSGTATLKAAAFTSGIEGTSGTLVDAVRAAVMSRGDIVKYTGGVSYYNIRIKHFGDVLTPWNNGEFKTGSAPQNYTSTDDAAAKIAKIYPAADDSRQDNNYLGRYGVLRNNWYHLTINKINYLGEPVPHTGNWPDTPDDEMENYISFQINILSWAKRTQSVDL